MNQNERMYAVFVEITEDNTMRLYGLTEPTPDREQAKAMLELLRKNIPKARIWRWEPENL